MKTRSTTQSVELLSGGNQQKVMVGKWLRLEPRLLLFDEPTQGVDIGAKGEIHQLIEKAASTGSAVVVCSTDEFELRAALPSSTCFVTWIGYGRVMWARGNRRPDCPIDAESRGEPLKARYGRKMSIPVRPVPDLDDVPAQRTVDATSRKRQFTFGVDRFSGLYLILILILVWSLLEPNTFRTLGNARNIASQSAISGIVALSAVVALASGAFDLSIGATMGWAIVFLGWLQEHGMNPILAVLIVVVGGIVIGGCNAFLVTRVRVNTVITTLGTSSILLAASYWLVGGLTIVSGISGRFITWGGQGKLLTVPVPVFYLFGIALILWYVLEHTPGGRFVYAIGFNPEASRLAGVGVDRLRWMCFIGSAVIATLAGIIFTAQVGSAPYDAGTPYLLPAYSAAFLAPTQIRPGRFNVAGAMVGVSAWGRRNRTGALPQLTCVG